jgi:hypothetical protein
MTMPRSHVLRITASPSLRYHLTEAARHLHISRARLVARILETQLDQLERERPQPPPRLSA